jgi:hypothetical protein
MITFGSWAMQKRNDEDAWSTQSLMQATSKMRVNAVVLKAVNSKREEDVVLESMNKKHCVIPIGGKTRVVTWGELPDFPGRETIVMASSLSDFGALHDKYRVLVEVWDKDTKKWKKVPRPLGTWWIRHEERRQYDNGMRFMPDTTEPVVNGTLNLWRGFRVAARKPEGTSGAAGCKQFLDHGLKIICSGDEEVYDFLIKREAYIAQKRTRSEVAVGLKTEDEGTGKGTWERMLNRLYGSHAMQISNPQHLIGKHNPHLEALLRLTADEALFALDPRHRNALYGLITEPELTIEPKFCGVYQAINYLNIDLTSNADHFLPASGSARRLLVPTVSKEKMNDHNYFQKINVQMYDEGGLEALLYFLLNEVDIRTFNVRAIPKTAALAEQVAYSRKGVDLLVEKACHEAYVPCQGAPGYSVCTRWGDRREHESFDDFIGRHPDPELKRIQALTVKRRLVKDWGCITGNAARQTVAGWQVHGILWPSLADLRAKFEEKYGKQEWASNARDWQHDVLPDNSEPKYERQGSPEEEPQPPFNN